MVHYTNSNVFNTNVEVIVNTINCVGFMGKGLAFEYSLRYPDLLRDYKDKCKKNEIQVGKMYYYYSNNQLILNFPTKKDYKFPSQINWIEDGLIDFVNTYKDYNIKSIAFPLLGCSNGGLDYKCVIKLMEKYLSNLDIEVYICHDKNGAEGKEKEMLEKFKACNIYDLSKEIKLNYKQIDKLIESQKLITRFYQISKIDGIGITTYKNIFTKFYNSNSLIAVQQTLF